MLLFRNQRLLTDAEKNYGSPDSRTCSKCVTSHHVFTRKRKATRTRTGREQPLSDQDIWTSCRTQVPFPIALTLYTRAQARAVISPSRALSVLLRVRHSSLHRVPVCSRSSVVLLPPISLLSDAIHHRSGFPFRRRPPSGAKGARTRRH